MVDQPEVEAALAGLGRARGPDDRGAHRKEGIKARLFGRRPPSRRLGRFIELGRLGGGGMGEVFRAYDEVLDRQIAVKLVRADRADEEKRLLSEAQALARLSHPNVVQIYEVGLMDGRLFIAMELVRGMTFQQWQARPRSWKECLEVYIQAGQGLAAAHGEGLVHRDFKPANCVLDEEGRVRVLDFGLATAEASGGESSRPTVRGRAEVDDRSSGLLDARLTETGSVVGTRAYMAPEQLLRRPADAKSDQFSFCVALYEALYDQLPFTRNPIPVLREMAAGRERAPELPPAGKSAPKWLQRVLWRGLHASPESRWPSMRALLEALDRGRRRSWVRWASLAGAALGGLVLGLPWWSPAPNAPEPCEDASLQIELLWNDEQRERMHDAMLATGLPHAADTVVRTQRRLDAYAREWARLYSEACIATRVRHQLPVEAFELQRRCLEHGRTALGHDVELLARADEQLVDHAVELVTRLPPLARCSDTAALAKAAVHERSPRLEEEIESLRGSLHRARSLELTGKVDDGLALVERPVARARELDEPRLLSEALLVRGQLYVSAGRYDEAEPSLRSAYLGAVEHRMDDVAAEALSELVYVLGIHRARMEAAQWLGSTAEALVARESVDGRLAGLVLTAVAQVQTREGGDLAAARERFEDALQSLDGLRGEESLARVPPLDGLAQVSRRQGDPAAAEALYREALELRERWLGPQHPATAHVRSNLCGVLSSLHEPARAEAECRRALEILEETPRPDHERLFHTRNNLGSALSKQGRRPESAAELLEAVDSAELAYGPEHPYVAMTRLNLGDVLRAMDQGPKAMAEYRAVLEILRANEPTVEHRLLEAGVLRRLGVAQVEQGRLDEGEASYREALGVLKGSVGERHPQVASLLNRLGGLMVERGDAVQAELLHQQALDIYEDDPETERMGIANTLRALARARLARRRWNEASEPLERALELYAAIEPAPKASRIADAELMLAEVLRRQGALDEAIVQARQARARCEVGDSVEARASAWLREHAPSAEEPDGSSP